jgi:peptide/nickel transport system substrate-binding protein
VARALGLAAAISLLAVSGAGGATGATSAATPRPGGTLVFTQPQPEPACLDLMLEQCATGTALITLERLSNRVLEAPFDVGPDLTWRPRLVSRVTFTRTPPFVLVYHIRPEARWSDGVQITARDFVFTHRAILRYGYGELRALHKALRSVRAVDAATVRVALRSREARWHALFGGVLPAHALEGHDLRNVWRDRIDNPRTGAPIGSGPFLVQRWDRGRQITLVRNPRYWRGDPAYLDRLVVRFEPKADGTTLAEAFRERRIHIAYSFPSNFLPDLRREASAKIVKAPAMGYEHLDLNLGPGGNPLLRDKVVRRAIAYGIDRVALARQLTEDFGLAYRLLDSVVFLRTSRYYEPHWSRYSHRPARARKLLEQVGCRRGGDGIYSCAGTRLSLRFVAHVSPGSIRPRIVELLQAQLRQAGVEVLPQFAPQATVFGPGGILERGAFDAVVFAWVIDEPDSAWKDLFGCQATDNYTGYCQRLVTARLGEAEKILDPEQQARALNAADSEMANDVPVLPLFQHPNWVALAPAVRGFTLNANFDALVGAENWWLAG